MFHWLDAEAGDALQTLSPQGREVARTWADRLAAQMVRLKTSKLAALAIEKAHEWEQKSYSFAGRRH